MNDADLVINLRAHAEYQRIWHRSHRASTLCNAAADRIAELEARIDNLTAEVANAREARP